MGPNGNSSLTGTVAAPHPTPSARGPGLHVGLRSFWSLRRPEEERHPPPSDSARASGPPGAGFAHAQCGAASERVAGPLSPASCGPRRTHAVPVPLLGRVQTPDPRRAAPAATSPGRRRPRPTRCPLRGWAGVGAARRDAGRGRTRRCGLALESARVRAGVRGDGKARRWPSSDVDPKMVRKVTFTVRVFCPSVGMRQK